MGTRSGSCPAGSPAVAALGASENGLYVDYALRPEEVRAEDGQAHGHAGVDHQPRRLVRVLGRGDRDGELGRPRQVLSHDVGGGQPLHPIHDLQVFQAIVPSRGLRYSYRPLVEVAVRSVPS